MSDMLQMIQAFFSGRHRYRQDAKRHDGWIQKHGRNRGWSVSPRRMLYTDLKLWPSYAEAMFGRRCCPCFEPSGDSDLDCKLIRPCAFAEGEIEARLVPVHAVRLRRSTCNGSLRSGGTALGGFATVLRYA